MRASKICADPECPNLVPCPDHGAKPWETSGRKERSTLSGSRQQKRRRYILTRDGTICHVCGNPGADEADHVIPLAQGGADTAENMAAIHSEPCHREKTAREAKEGKR